MFGYNVLSAGRTLWNWLPSPIKPIADAVLSCCSVRYRARKQHIKDSDYIGGNFREDVLAREEEAGWPLDSTNAEALRVKAGDIFEKLRAIRDDDVVTLNNKIAALDRIPPESQVFEFSAAQKAKNAAGLLARAALVAPPFLLTYIVAASIGAKKIVDSRAFYIPVGIICALVNVALAIFGTKDLINAYVDSIKHFRFRNVSWDILSFLSSVLTNGVKLNAFIAAIGVSFILVDGADAGYEEFGFPNAAYQPINNIWTLLVQTAFTWQILSPFTDRLLYNTLGWSTESTALATANEFIGDLPHTINDPAMLMRLILMQEEVIDAPDALRNMVKIQMANELKASRNKMSRLSPLYWGGISFAAFFCSGAYSMFTAPSVAGSLSDGSLPDWFVNYTPLRLGNLSDRGQSLIGAAALNCVVWVLYTPYMRRALGMFLRNIERLACHKREVSHWGSELAVNVLFNIIALITIATAAQQLFASKDQEIGDNWFANALETLNQNTAGFLLMSFLPTLLNSALVNWISLQDGARKLVKLCARMKCRSTPAFEIADGYMALDNGEIDVDAHRALELYNTAYDFLHLAATTAPLQLDSAKDKANTAVDIVRSALTIYREMPEPQAPVNENRRTFASLLAPSASANDLSPSLPNTDHTEQTNGVPVNIV